MENCWVFRVRTINLGNSSGRREQGRGRQLRAGQGEGVRVLPPLVGKSGSAPGICWKRAAQGETGVLLKGVFDVSVQLEMKKRKGK